MTKIRRICDERKMFHFEGERGVQNLCRLARECGYFDRQYFGQFAQDASYGDLIQFLEDNPGAQQAIVAFMEEYEDDFEGLKDMEGEDDTAGTD